MKKVVIINQDSGYLITDIANEYAKTYDSVSLICGRLVEHDRRLNPAIKVENIIRYDRNGKFKRIKTWVIASFQIMSKLVRHYKDYEIVYVTNPPLACFCSLFLKNKFKVIEFDVYPDALKSMGIGPSNLIYKTWSFFKKKLYKKVERVYTLSEGMKTIVSQYVDQSKIKYVPLWSASSNLHPIDKNDNVFVRENGFDGKFIVMYSGNIGFTHNVECLIEVAKQMKDYNNILFLIIGEGKKKDSLVAMANQEHLNNVIFLPFQKVEMLPYSLSSADIGVISLDETISKASVPSKTFNLLAAGVPILAIASSDTEICRLIQKYKCGNTIEKRNINKMVEYIKCLYGDEAKLKDLKTNSQKASKDFSYTNASLYL